MRGPHIPLVFWDEAAERGAAVAVTTRHGGVSPHPYDSLNLGLHVGDDPVRVIHNRERAAHAFGVTLDNLVFAEQVHGATVTEVGSKDTGRGSRTMDDAIVATDILVTSSDRITLVILVADCVPVALLDPKARVLAVVHAGWRGTAAGAVGQAVDALCQLGAQPERMMAFLGPAVAPTSYQVTSEVTQALARAVAPADLHADVAQSDGTDHWHVDLTAANRQQLTLAGIDPAQMFESGSTTADGDYFSDRASRPCGRFGLMAQLLAT